MFFICATKGPVGTTVSDLPEMERALREINELLRPDNTSDVYWETIRDKLLAESASKDLQKAIKEWSQAGKPFPVDDSTCELCGKHPILWNFPILNKVRKKRLLIGSECIQNFLHISFKTDLTSIASVINRRIKVLKRQEQGLKTRGFGLSEAEELLVLEAAIRDFIQGASHEDDFLFVEHLYALNEPLRLYNALGLRTPAKEAANKALEACLAIRRVAQKNGLQVGNSTGVMAVVRAVIKRRNSRERKAHLEAIRSALGKIFQGREPNDVVVRLYEDLDGYRTRFVDAARVYADGMKAKARERYADYLAFVERYDHLHFVLDAGVQAVREQYDQRLAEYERLSKDKDMLDKVMSLASSAPGAFDAKTKFPEPDFSNFTDVRARLAKGLVEFLHDVQRGDWKGLVRTVEETFGRNVQDEAGVLATLLQAADDSLVVPEEKGPKAIAEFDDLVALKAPGVTRLLLKEVDDLADIRIGEAKLFDRMSRDLGFDVEDVFRYFDADNDADAKLCRRLFALWQAGRRPSAEDLKVFLTRKAARPARPQRTMLDQIKADIGSDVGWIIKQASLAWTQRAA